MVEAKQVQDRGMYIVDMNRVVHGVHTKIIRSTQARPPFHSSPDPVVLYFFIASVSMVFYCYLEGC